MFCISSTINRLHNQLFNFIIKDCQLNSLCEDFEPTISFVLNSVLTKVLGVNNELTYCSVIKEVFNYITEKQKVKYLIYLEMLLNIFSEESESVTISDIYLITNCFNKYECK